MRYRRIWARPRANEALKHIRDAWMLGGPVIITKSLIGSNNTYKDKSGISFYYLVLHIGPYSTYNYSVHSYSFMLPNPPKL